MKIIRGSYNNDCIFLLKDLTGILNEISIEEKENLISKGISYSNFISKEEITNIEIENLFKSMVCDLASDMAGYVAILAESIYQKKGSNLVIVSLARAGTPYGILIKRYLNLKYNINLKHYSISIIRGKGIDYNALKYILDENKNGNIQFIDGWTGKGSISKELDRSIDEFNRENNENVDKSLAVIADPAKLCDVYATREDIALPNCLLNATVSGLISRTILNDKYIDKDDFHGAINIDYLKNYDYSNFYVDSISEKFETDICKSKLLDTEKNYSMQVVEEIKEKYDVKDINKIKLSIGEAARVLLRRKARILLLSDFDDVNVKALKMLAEIKNVRIEKYKGACYRAIAIIE